MKRSLKHKNGLGSSPPLFSWILNGEGWLTQDLSLSFIFQKGGIFVLSYVCGDHGRVGVEAGDGVVEEEEGAVDAVRL